MQKIYVQKALLWSSDLQHMASFLKQVTYTVPVKSLDTPTHSRVFLYFTIFYNVDESLDDSFAHSWYSLNQLHLECFSNSLEAVPTYAEHLLAAFSSLWSPTHPRPSHLGWGWVIVEARSSDAAFHHSLLGQIALTQPGGVLGLCPVEK